MQNYVADTQNSGHSVDIIVFFATRMAALRQHCTDSVPALVMMYIAGIHTWWMTLPLHTTPWLPAVTPAGMGNDFADMLQDLGDAEGISSMQLQHFCHVVTFLVRCYYSLTASANAISLPLLLLTLLSGFSTSMAFIQRHRVQGIPQV